MGKVKTFGELKELVQKEKKKGKKVGLITGCFDILHPGHIDLLNFAKKHVDIVIVGLDNDRSIKLSKGKDKPVFPVTQRSKVLCALNDVDYVFVIKTIFRFNTTKSQNIHEDILYSLDPTYLITNKNADIYWKNKYKSVNNSGIKLLIDNHKKKFSSSKLSMIIKYK